MDDPPYLPVGTEVSAKYKGAFCEAKIRKIVRVVKCRVTYKAGLGSSGWMTDDQIKGTLRIGSTVEAKHQDKNQFVEATINKIQDCSQYTVVFDDGDITTLRRSALCLKSGRHFNESETLDQLPLTHPEHFSNPVVGGRSSRGVRRSKANNDDNDRDDSSEDEDLPVKKGRKKTAKEADMGTVVCVDSTDKKRPKDVWFPALVVSPSAQETVKIRTKDEYLVRSFRDGRYYTVPKKETTGFTKDINKSELISNLLRTACDKAIQFLEKNELPPHWDRDVLFGHQNATKSDDCASESEGSEDDPREDKDRFIAQLYKFMDERGTPINKDPVVCNKDLDLYKLYKIVTSRGGYNKVSNSSQWKPVTIKMGYGNMPTTSTINLVKQAYKKFLQNFEELYRKLGCSLTSVDSRPSSASGKSRSHRSIFRERHASTPVKEKEDASKIEKEKEKKEEEEKKAQASSSSSSAAGVGETETESETVPNKKSEPSDDSRRSRSRLDGKSKKDSEESVSETNTPPVAPPPPVKNKRVYKKKTDTATTTSTPTSSASGPTPTTTTTTTTPVASNNSTPTASSVTNTPASSSTNTTNNNNSAAAIVNTTTTSNSASATTPTSSSATTVDNSEKIETQTPTTSTSPAPSMSGSNKRGRGKYKKKEKDVPPEEEIKSKVEESPSQADHIGKNVKIQVGDKLSVYYPHSEGKVTYEAKVVDINEENKKYLVHYAGWNARYDEWITRFRISGFIEQEGNSGNSDQNKNVNDSNSDLESVNQTSQNSKQQGGKTPKRKGRPTSAGGTQKDNASSNKNNKNSNSGSGAVVRRRQFSESERGNKKRRPRRKSGQDSFTQSGSGSDSDSERDTIPMTSTPPTSGSYAPSSLARTSKGRNKKSTYNNEDDEDSVSSSTSSGHGKNAKVESRLTNSGGATTASSTTTTTTTTATAANNNSSSSNNNSNTLLQTQNQVQVLDLVQIRSEMKGLDKMVKLSASSPSSTSSSSSITSTNTTINSSSQPQQQQQSSLTIPTPTSLSSNSGTTSLTSPAHISIPTSVITTSASEGKLDVYEFQEDANDAPKLKMFSPRSPDKKDETGGGKLSNSNSGSCDNILTLDDHVLTKESVANNASNSTLISTSPNVLAVSSSSSIVLLPHKSSPLNTQSVSKNESSPSSGVGKGKKEKELKESGKSSASLLEISSTSSSSVKGKPYSTNSSQPYAAVVVSSAATAVTGMKLNAPILQTTAIEMKPAIRLLTPIVHTPQQPLRQRATLSTAPFQPPSLVPNISSLKTILPVPIQPRPMTTASTVTISTTATTTSGPSSGPPLIQRPGIHPIIATHIQKPGTTTGNNVATITTTTTLQQQQSIMTPLVTTSAIVQPPTSTTAAIVRGGILETKSPFTSRQILPLSTSKTGISSNNTSVTNTSTTASSASTISLSAIPMTPISPSQAMFHSSASLLANNKDIGKQGGVGGIQLAKGGLVDSSVPGVGNSSLAATSTSGALKKPNLKRKKPVKDKAPEIAKMDTIVHQQQPPKPKKKPKKVVTKNIMDTQKDNSPSKDNINSYNANVSVVNANTTTTTAASTGGIMSTVPGTTSSNINVTPDVKKPRKPVAKKLKLDKAETSTSSPTKRKAEKVVKDVKEKKQPRKKYNKNEAINKNTPVHSVTLSSNLGTAHYLLAPTSSPTIHSGEKGEPSTTTASNMPSVKPGGIKMTTVMEKSSDLLASSTLHFHSSSSSSLSTSTLEHQTTPSKQFSKSSTSTQQSGVLKTAEKKSYAPKMSPATTARVISCIDNVAKLPADNVPATSTLTATTPLNKFTPTPSSFSQIKLDSAQKLSSNISTAPIGNVNSSAATSTATIAPTLPVSTYTHLPSKQTKSSVFMTSTTTLPTTIATTVGKYSPGGNSALTFAKVSKISGDSPSSSSRIPIGYSPMVTTTTASSADTLVLNSKQQFLSKSLQPSTLILSSSSGDGSSTSASVLSHRNVKPVTVTSNTANKDVSKPSLFGSSLSISNPSLKNTEVKAEKQKVTPSCSNINAADSSPSQVSLLVVTKDKEQTKSKLSSNAQNGQEEKYKVDSKDNVFTTTITPSTQLSSLSATEDVKEGTKKEEDESCHSLLCEEIIPGSPPPGSDGSLFGIDDENARLNSPTSHAVKKEVGVSPSASSSSSSKMPNISFGTSATSSPFSSTSTYNASRNPQGNSKEQTDSTFGGSPSQKPVETTSSNNNTGNNSKTHSNSNSSLHSNNLNVGHTKDKERGGERSSIHHDASKKSEDVFKSRNNNLGAAESLLQKQRGEVGKAAQSLLSLSGIEQRPSSSSTGHTHQNSGYNHPHQSMQHVMDNTPPTTPESSSTSSGSPRVDGGRVSPTNDHPSSSKSTKDSSDGDSVDNHKTHEAAEEGSSSDAGRKSIKSRGISPQKKHRVESIRNSRTSSPPLKRRRIQRKKSPDEIVRPNSYRGRGYGGGRKGNSNTDTHDHSTLAPPLPINLAKPPKSNKFNFIPDLAEDLESEMRIEVLTKALQDIKEKYLEIRAELTCFERRRKRWKRREKEREKTRVSSQKSL